MITFLEDALYAQELERADIDCNTRLCEISLSFAPSDMEFLCEKA